MVTKVNQIVLNGLPFQYRETGDPSAPPLVALHAMGKSSESWDQVAEVLGEKYHVLALDQRGHGGSARTPSYSFELMSDDLLHFVNTLNLEKFTLLGHSMGGTVSYLFSETFPSRIEKLILEDTPPPFPDKPIEIPAKPSEDLSFDWPVVPSILNQLNVPNPLWWSCLPNITSPSLVIGGGSSSHIPQNKLQEVSELIPNCELVTIDNGGHHVHETNLSAFLTTIKRFLNA